MQFARLASLLILAFTATVLAAPGVVDNLAPRVACCTCVQKRELPTERPFRDALFAELVLVKSPAVPVILFQFYGLGGRQPLKGLADSPSSRQDLRASIFDLDSRILELVSALDSARSERKKLWSQLNQFKYPILTLPVEITSAIFVASLPEYPKSPPMLGPNSPTSLAQVCRHWRAVAFGMPELWRAIQIKRWGSCSFEILKSWLSRSGTHSISLTLKKLYGHSPSFSELEDFTETIIGHCARVEHMRLVIPLSDDLRWLQGLPFHRLRHLVITPSSAWTEPDALPSTLFTDAPQLTSVKFNSRFRPSGVVLPWIQITTIHAEHFELDRLAQILRQAPALAHLNCTMWSWRDEPIDDIPPAIHLHSLVLRGDSDAGTTQQHLLNALTAPSLRQLSVSAGEFEDSQATLISFFARSQCSLDSLRITSTLLHETDYRASFPSINIIRVSAHEDFSDEDGDEGDEDSDSDDEWDG
ncbi:hypothetical protein C8J57DRAFT_1474324 [Mycena rebaudengoi]|nr:hypothetical protein C8J57DRAFT_1474324 [Mycena rebaudengoi]